MISINLIMSTLFGLSSGYMLSLWTISLIPKDRSWKKKSGWVVGFMVGFSPCILALTKFALDYMTAGVPEL